MRNFRFFPKAGSLTRSIIGEDDAGHRPQGTRRPRLLGRWRGMEKTGGGAGNVRVGLGFRRLSILDLSEKGAQPMATPAGGHVLAFNGQIYNYLEAPRAIFPTFPFAQLPIPRYCFMPSRVGAWIACAAWMGCSPSRCMSRAKIA